jgi:methylated-DNA-[protein]-cysteine S-methyltransferase
MEKGIVNTEIGSIIVYVKDNKAIKIEFKNEFLKEIELGIFKSQIKEYFEGKRKKLLFNVEINTGKTFKKIWDFVREIPYGQTMTYGQIAKILNVNPRVVGFAMSKNPLPIYIPCHRVVGKNDIHGFTGGRKWKEYLLNLESSQQY